MSYCKNCGKEISDGKKFLPDCGAELTVESQGGNQKDEKKVIVYAGFALALCSIFVLFFNYLISLALGAVALIVYFTSNDVSDMSLKKFSKTTMYASIAALAIDLIILCVDYFA